MVCLVDLLLLRIGSIVALNRLNRQTLNEDRGVDPEGLEPTRARLKGECSVAELRIVKAGCNDTFHIRHQRVRLTIRHNIW